ncbi:MAG: hypothetical protein ABIO16_00700 [Nocardioides sp.]
MTDQRLRELLDERVADVDARVDLSAAAWARAGGVRRRRRYAVVGTAAAAVVLVSAGTLAIVDQRDITLQSPSGRVSTLPTPEPTIAPEIPRAELGGNFRGAPFWWAPPAALDAELPVLQVPGLPEELSMAEAPAAGDPPDHVDAVFGTGKQQYLLFSDETMTAVDLSDRLGPVADEGGNEFSPLGFGSVSPDGSMVLFRQPGQLEVWNLPSDSWRTVEVADVESIRWTRDGHLGVVNDGRPDPWTGDHQYAPAVAGPDGTAAELDWMEGTDAPTIPGRSDQVANPEFLAAGTPDAPVLLAFGMGRNKMCCVPMAWFSHDFVLFSASSPDGAHRVLAWRVGTPDVYRVSEYTDLPERNFSASWAEDAFQ